jgi:hypothetical protein
MKYCSIILVLFLLSTGSVAGQNKYLRKFYREEKRKGHGETFKIGLGRITLKLAAWIIPASVMEEQGVPLKHLLSKVQRLKLYTIEGNSGDSTTGIASMMKLKKVLVERYHYDPLMEVRDEGSVVHILNKGKEGDLGNLILLVKDENDFVILHLRTTLKMEELSSVVQQLTKS